MQTVIWALSSGEETPETQERVFRLVKEKYAELVGLFIIDPKVADVLFNRVSGSGFLGGKPSQNLHAAILRDYKDRAHRRLKQFEEAARAHGVKAEGVLRRGEFGETCTVLVQERSAALLVLGELSKYSFYQFLKGQATLDGLKKSVSCPIEIMKPE